MIAATASEESGSGEPGTELEVIVHGETRAARVLGEPAYDPESLLPRTDQVLTAAE